MTSTSLCNETPADRILATLKRGGAATHAVLAAELSVSIEAVRQQMGRLEQAGLVRAHDEVRGIGRPVRVWSLTAAGHARFPDRHDQLATGLIEAMREVIGADGLISVLKQRGRDLEAAYTVELSHLPLSTRVERLAELRHGEGYMAEAVAEADGSFTLIEHHCAICAAATACQGFCAEELRVFRSLFPDASVERTEHLLGNGRRCVYRIVPVA